MIVLPRAQHRLPIEDTRLLVRARPLHVQLCGIAKNKANERQTKVILISELNGLGSEKPEIQFLVNI